MYPASSVGRRLGRAASKQANQTKRSKGAAVQLFLPSSWENCCSLAEWMAQNKSKLLFTTKMVGPKSLKFMNSGSEAIVSKPAKRNPPARGFQELSQNYALRKMQPIRFQVPCVFFEDHAHHQKETQFTLAQKLMLKSSKVGSTVDERNPAPLGNHEKPLFVGIYRGIMIPWFLRWCRISSIHSMDVFFDGTPFGLVF